MKKPGHFFPIVSYNLDYAGHIFKRCSSVPRISCKLRVRCIDVRYDFESEEAALYHYGVYSVYWSLFSDVSGHRWSLSRTIRASQDGDSSILSSLTSWNFFNRNFCSPDNNYFEVQFLWESRIKFLIPFLVFQFSEWVDSPKMTWVLFIVFIIIMNSGLNNFDVFQSIAPIILFFFFWCTNSPIFIFLRLFSEFFWPDLSSLW